MAKQSKSNEKDQEIIAIGEVYSALKDLDNDARARVLNYVYGKFNIRNTPIVDREPTFQSTPQVATETSSEVDDDFDGISPAGKKWITRSGITPSKLGEVFSLGIDDIDLVSKTIPGSNKAQKMRNVFLLKGVAAYLSTGAARFAHDQIKEACLHYNAWDGPNFASNFKKMAADVSGGKEAGYTLTAKGLSDATTLIKDMLNPASKT